MTTPLSTTSADTPANASKVTELRFQKLFEDADAMSIQGYLPDGTVVYWNHASENIYGYTAAEAIGGNLLDLIIPEEMRAAVEGAVRWMFETRQGIPPSRLDLKHKDGRSVPVYSSHTVVAIEGQTPVLFCMDADMRALADAEVELRVAATAFESQQAMAIADATGKILRVNQAFTQATGYTANEVVGRTPKVFGCTEPAPGFFASLRDILMTTGAWQGEIQNTRKDGNLSADWITINAVRDAAGAVTHFVGTMTDTTQRRQAEAKILQLAFYDQLTSLPNRRLLQDRLHQAATASRRSGNRGALLFIDVDDFKTLNDTLGHAVGDLLLKQIAQRLSLHLRESDTAGRFGGDKFMLMLEDLGQDVNVAAAKAETVAGGLLQALVQPYKLGEFDYHGSVSIGMTVFATNGTSDEDLFKQAELAMYAAKSAGRKTLRFYDVQMQTAVNLHAAMVNCLRQALAEGHFALHFQAQVDRHNAIQGAEALLRWNRPGHGLVGPADFIPAAEQSGLILPMGAWVLETACTTLVSWASQTALSHLTLSVNVSAIQFQHPDFVSQVQDILHRSGARASQLKLELTESTLLTGIDEVIDKMDALRALGISFSLDDFGTGYSSLSYLRRLPLSQLKIDQSFVLNMHANPSSSVIVKAIIALGQNLGLSVMAEGVETADQLAFLRLQGCDAVQGYFFSRPLELDAFESFVRAAARLAP